MITEPERALMTDAYAGDGVSLYWGLSPYYVRNRGYANVRLVTPSGASVSDFAYTSIGARPAVSLRRDATYNV